MKVTAVAKRQMIAAVPTLASDITLEDEKGKTVVVVPRTGNDEKDIAFALRLEKVMNKEFSKDVAS